MEKKKDKINIELDVGEVMEIYTAINHRLAEYITSMIFGDETEAYYSWEYLNEILLRFVKALSEHLDKNAKSRN